MFSAPRLGPTVRSSMISIGAAIEPGADQACNVAGFARRHAAADLEVAAQLALNHWRSDHFRFAFSISTMAMRVANVLAGDLAQHARALTVGADTHDRLVALTIECRFGAVDAFAGDDVLFLHRDLAAVAVVHQLGAIGHIAVLGGLQRSTVLLAISFDHAQFERTGATDHVFQARRVGGTRHLDHDAVGAWRWMIGSVRPSALMRLPSTFWFCSMAESASFFLNIFL